MDRFGFSFLDVDGRTAILDACVAFGWTADFCLTSFTSLAFFHTAIEIQKCEVS